MHMPGMGIEVGSTPLTVGNMLLFSFLLCFELVLHDFTGFQGQSPAGMVGKGSIYTPTLLKM